MPDQTYIVLYETFLGTGWKPHHTKTKAILIVDDNVPAELPFGFEPEFLGPDEDEVYAIVAIINVTGVETPFITIGDEGFEFDATGAPKLVEMGHS